MSKIKEFKSELKKLAALIREGKQTFKESQRQLNYTIYQDWCKKDNNNVSIHSYGGKTFVYPQTMDVLSNKYRHMHIAYCLLRGKKYEQIEPKVKENNEPHWPSIEAWMNTYRESDPISCGDSAV